MPSGRGVARFSFSLLALLLSGCAGPSTPFGAVKDLLPERPKSHFEILGLAAEGPKRTSNESITSFSFEPRRQNFHQPTTLQVRLGPLKKPFLKKKLKVYYNGIDVTDPILSRSQFWKDQNFQYFTIPNFRFLPDRDHRLVFKYKSQRFPDLVAELKEPECSAFEPMSIEHVKPFQNVSNEWLSFMRKTAVREGINPALIAALIAQESSFDPESVSWAKAIGLTQITSLAEQEIVSSYPKWPRYPKLNRYSVLTIKGMIYRGTLHRENEWRLHPKHSIEGGVSFLGHLARRFTEPEFEQRLATFFDDLELVQTRMLLAAYNSGASRVLRAFHKFGPNWLESEELTQAKSYVNKVQSFCYHFSEV
jgi:hypothetical protein